MNRFHILKALHLIFLGLLLTFIYFYFAEYQPLKVHSACAESSAKSVLNFGSNTDAFGFYNQLYKNCISQKGSF
ncbi:hypothetical protein A3J19_04595 [Candidatus Daviesbacteria bacterium RIFCSPLOWO2_02_FULL_41_8]|uniref:Uncharacterized protein n=3 Tax=Candidatus Daviesiibacteriota TaxID=1752718 RepID=A0A1F5NJ84_9BACT|nr:MAG: hypothetical protein A2871_03165 [Candidatus Daviesbacteria bacterium RIFCSPHIGHO2_01_FULL_41_23]OGE32410.1 MAG: hypothetical protein A3D83_02010 [Candidatus Daviesbacteria bacterium RIFCSPHIGHO2_02_FULL_41_10]OGE61929.1 MAG: hypothetical protein A2967_02980 [Candidatus Daviesbacteria bacterium RIFCSPLOWO2_01_FULL_41_32]OGE77705.1 MAG: hypothetical protein A3J19_04595 [Candidatus Daviesbacteria bacterium RIFCSPLOWO2_02_FULL_41_8]